MPLKSALRLWQILLQGVKSMKKLLRFNPHMVKPVSALSGGGIRACGHVYALADVNGNCPMLYEFATLQEMGQAILGGIDEREMCETVFFWASTEPETTINYGLYSAVADADIVIVRQLEAGHFEHSAAYGATSPSRKETLARLIKHYIEAKEIDDPLIFVLETATIDKFPRELEEWVKKHCNHQNAKIAATFAEQWQEWRQWQ